MTQSYIFTSAELQVYDTKSGQWVDTDAIPLTLKLSKIWQRVDNFIGRLNNEWSTSIRASLIAESQEIADPDRLLLYIQIEIPGRDLRFNAGYFNKKTKRYNKAYDTNAVDLSKKKDSSAFGLICKEVAAILGIKEWWGVSKE